jgi:hypothetical protein
MELKTVTANSQPSKSTQPETVISSTNAPPIDGKVASATIIEPALVPTPTGTISITLTPPLPPMVPIGENVTVIVGGLTLLGVIFSLVAAHWRMKSELAASEKRMLAEISAMSTQGAKEREQVRDLATSDRAHQEKLAHKERITTARRVTYTEAASELVKAQMFLGSLPNRDLTKLDVEAGLGDLMAAVAKIAILGEMETVLKSRKLLSLIQCSFFRSLRKAMSMMQKKADITNLEKLYDQTDLERNRIITTMRNHVETSSTDQIAFAALGRSFDAQQEYAKQHREKISEIGGKLRESHMEYARSMLDEAKVISRNIDDLLVCVRMELGLYTLPEQLHQSTQETQANATTALSELLDALFQASQRTSSTSE